MGEGRDKEASGSGEVREELAGGGLHGGGLGCKERARKLPVAVVACWVQPAVGGRGEVKGTRNRVLHGGQCYGPMGNIRGLQQLSAASVMGRMAACGREEELLQGEGKRSSYWTTAAGGQKRKTDAGGSCCCRLVVGATTAATGSLGQQGGRKVAAGLCRRKGETASQGLGLKVMWDIWACCCRVDFLQCTQLAPMQRLSFGGNMYYKCVRPKSLSPLGACLVRGQVRGPCGGRA